MTSAKSSIKIWKYLLLPVAWLYGWGVRLRHLLFNKGWLHAQSFDLPIICVGNLSTGGTGKTPAVLYLLELLEGQNVATLSRGYRRKTKGFLVADGQTGVQDLGDEPYLFHKQFPRALVSVAEDRVGAVRCLLQRTNPPEVILLDDGFQHRRIRPGYNILLTAYSNLFSSDYFLPVGQLRDCRSAARRAQMIIVTKCPPGLSLANKEKITQELIKYGPKIVLFSCIHYHTPYSLQDESPVKLDASVHILLFHGIANAKPLRDYVRKLDPGFKEISYEDHHDYTMADIKKIRQTFDQLPNGKKILLTTEKDRVKLEKWADELQVLPVYILPIKMEFLFGQSALFNKEIQQYINNYKY